MKKCVSLQTHLTNESLKMHFFQAWKILDLKKAINIYCGVEQLVARRAHNPKVVRSSRAPATIERIVNLAILFSYILNFGFISNLVI